MEVQKIIYISFFHILFFPRVKQSYAKWREPVPSFWLMSWKDKIVVMRKIHLS